MYFPLSRDSLRRYHEKGYNVLVCPSSYCRSVKQVRYLRLEYRACIEALMQIDRPLQNPQIRKVPASRWTYARYAETMMKKQFRQSYGVDKQASSVLSSSLMKSIARVM